MFVYERRVVGLNPVAVTIKKADVRIGDSFTFWLNELNSLLNSQLKLFEEKQFGSLRVSCLTQVNDTVIRISFVLVINIRMIIILVEVLWLEW